MTTPDQVQIRRLANAIRMLSVDGVETAKSGHPGLPMGMADVATVLFQRFLKFDAANPAWPDRDRFVLSAGHGSMLLYALLYLTGAPDMTIDQLKSFRQWGSKTPGHPEAHAKGRSLGLEQQKLPATSSGDEGEAWEHHRRLKARDRAAASEVIHLDRSDRPIERSFGEAPVVLDFEDLRHGVEGIGIEPLKVPDG